jgi:Chaperone of endosialidase
MAQAVSPPPDGGYPGQNTAEGTNPLFSLTTGVNNTAIGAFVLFSNTTGSLNTGVGAGTLFFNTANNNTAVGAGALASNTTGDGNTANGALALLRNTEGRGNTANGDVALLQNTKGSGNTAIGSQALISNTTGSGNTAVGSAASSGAAALGSNTGGSFNTAIGRMALSSNTTGNGNIAVGSGAGSNLTTGDGNIDIGNAGVADEANTIRIGSTQIATFIAGINGVNEGSPMAVFINATTGRLGTTPPASSRRFKKEIRRMDKTSEAILALKPVTFQYKSDNKGVPQFGLIAEEVAAVNPDLIVRDDKGDIYSVRYEAVNAMLLNEFLKEHSTVQELKKQVAALTAGLQKVSAQLEASKPAPQVVSNNQ